MSTLTTNLSLVKPALTENADIAVINNNMDLLDAAVASKAPAAVTQRYVGDSANLDTVLANLDDAEFYKSMCGFVQWNSGTDANTYTVDSTGFTVVRSGIGYIKGKKITWTAGQKSAPIPAKTVVWIYIDSTGTVGVTTSAVGLYTDYIVLFYCWFDGTYYFVEKENHAYSFMSAISAYLHATINVTVRGTGILISKVGSGTGASVTDRQLLITGADYLDDHGLSTFVPATNPLSLMTVSTDITGKWTQRAVLTELMPYYNNAGTPTALDATQNSFAVYTIYALRDDINSSSPRFMAVRDIRAYPTLALAQSAVSSGSVSYANNEIETIEPCQLGYAIVGYSTDGGYIADVAIARNTFNQALVGGGSGSATNHAFLSNLDYEASGHTGFETPVGAQAKADVVQTNLTTHLADYVRQPGYAVDSGTANHLLIALTPAPTSYVDGMGVAAKVKVAGTAATDINVNSLGVKPIFDSLGNAVTNFKANVTYSMKYESVSGNFIVQGKGGGGTSLASDLYSGKTATVDTGQIIGTNPYKVGVAIKDVNLLMGAGGQGIEVWNNTVSLNNTGIAADLGGNVYVASTVNPGKAVRKFNSAGVEQWALSDIVNGKAVAVDSLANVYIAYMSAGVRKVSTSGSQIWTVSDVSNATGIAVDPSGNNSYPIYNNAVGTTSVRKLNSSGVQVWAKTDIGGVSSVAVDASGNVYVGYYNGQVRKLNSSGGQVWIIPAIGTSVPYDLAVDSSGNVYVAYNSTGGVIKYNSSGTLVWALTDVVNSHGIAVDSVGNVYVAYYNAVSTITIRKLSTAGIEIWHVQDSENYALDMAVDVSGNVYVTYESGTKRIRKLDGATYYTINS